MVNYIFQPTKTASTPSKDPNVVQSQQEEDDIAKGRNFIIIWK